LGNGVAASVLWYDCFIFHPSFFENSMKLRILSGVLVAVILVICASVYFHRERVKRDAALIDNLKAQQSAEAAHNANLKAERTNRAKRDAEDDERLRIESIRTAESLARCEASIAVSRLQAAGDPHGAARLRIIEDGRVQVWRATYGDLETDFMRFDLLK
jgi:hypothetical protein